MSAVSSVSVDPQWLEEYTRRVVDETLKSQVREKTKDRARRELFAYREEFDRVHKLYRSYADSSLRKPLSLDVELGRIDYMDSRYTGEDGFISAAGLRARLAQEKRSVKAMLRWVEVEKISRQKRYERQRALRQKREGRTTHIGSPTPTVTAAEHPLPPLTDEQCARVAALLSASLRRFPERIAQ